MLFLERTLHSKPPLEAQAEDKKETKDSPLPHDKRGVFCLLAMRFFTLQRPLLAAVAAISRPSVASGVVAPLGAQLANALVEGRRNASVKAQGAYRKKSKRGIPNKLGAKRTGGAFCSIAI